MWWVHRIPGRSVWLCEQLCVQITLQIKIHNTSGRQQVATLLDAISSTYTISKESTQGSQTKYTLLYSIHTYGDTQISGISAVPVWTPAVLNPPHSSHKPLCLRDIASMTPLDFLSFSDCLIAGAYRTNLCWGGVWSQAATLWLIGWFGQGDRKDEPVVIYGVALKSA